MAKLGATRLVLITPDMMLSCSLAMVRAEISSGSMRRIHSLSDIAPAAGVWNWRVIELGYKCQIVTKLTMLKGGRSNIIMLHWRPSIQHEEEEEEDKDKEEGTITIDDNNFWLLHNYKTICNFSPFPP